MKKETKVFLRFMCIIAGLIIINGVLAISEAYPSWIGYFNYLLAITPLFYNKVIKNLTFRF